MNTKVPFYEGSGMRVGVRVWLIASAMRLALRVAEFSIDLAN